MKAVRVVTVLLTSLAACAPTEVSGTLTVRTADAAPQDLARAADMLSARVQEFLPSFRSTVTSSVHGHAITLIFRGDPPPEEQIRYLATTRGELRIGPADEPSTVWVSDLDIEDVSLTSTDSGPFFTLRLKEQSGRALSEATARNVGRVVLVTLDGRRILAAPIRGAFGPTFQFNAPSVQEGLMMRAVLKGGRLPVVVESVDYGHGT